MGLALTFFLFLYGLAIGSFLNVVIDRLPRSRSLLHPPSHCDACGQRLGWRDLVPLFSYLRLRGRCRYCGAPVSPRLFLVELGSGLFLVIVSLFFGWSLLFAYVAFWGLVFLTLGVIDLETQLVPDVIVYPGLVVALGTAPFWSHLGWRGSLTGALIGFLALLIPAWLYREGMGWGDVKLAALIGSVTGFPGVLVALGSAFLLGGLVGGFLLACRRMGRKDPLPFVPFLSLGLLMALFWGETLVRWYWQLWQK